DRKSLRAWYKSMAEGKDEEQAKKAKAALKALDDEEKEEGEKKAKAEAEEKEKAAAQAKAEEEKKKEEEAKAKAGGDLAFQALKIAQETGAKIDAFMASQTKQTEDAQVAQLLASRPDFSAEMRTTL